MGTYLVTGSASGMGRATLERLRASGHRVVGVDLADADICADLATPAGRESVVAQAPEALDGAVLCAGLAGLTGRAGSLLVSVNYFGSVELVQGLTDRFVRGASIVLFSSNSTTIQPGWDPALVRACLTGDEQGARDLADAADIVSVYPATKAALVRWMRRGIAGWADRGVRINAVAPGLVATAMTEQLAGDETFAPFLEAFPVPVNRPGRAEEVAAFVEFLLGPDSTYFLGSFLVVDGGTEALLRPDDWPALWAPGSHQA